MGIRRHYVDISIGQVHGLIAGPDDGLPLVLLHQTSDAASMYEPVLPLLGALGYRAIAIDIPGQGNSVKPPHQPTGDEFASWTHEAVVAFGLGSYHLLGHHFGGTVAGFMAATIPTAVKSLMVYGWVDIKGTDWANDMVKAKPRIFDPNGEIVKHHWVRRWEMSGRELADPSENRFTEAMALRTMIALLQSGPSWYYAYHLLGGTDHKELAARINCPVLMFAGPRDHIYNESRDAVPNFPNAQWKHMDWVGVDVTDEEPEEFVNVIHSFISSVEKGSA